MLTREFFQEFVGNAKLEDDFDFSNPSSNWSKYTNAVTIAVSIDGKMVLKIGNK